MNVELLSDNGVEAYRAFLAQAPQSLLYATPEYHQFLQRIVPGERRTLVAVDKGRIQAALSYFRMQCPGIGTVVNSLPWYGSHGGCVLGAAAHDEARRSLLAAYQATLDETDDLLSATVVLSPAEQEYRALYHELLDVRATDERVGQITTLPTPAADVDAALLATFRQKTRNLVRKALRQGFELAEDKGPESWDFLVATHHENMRALGGRAKPALHFHALRETLPLSWQRLYVARFDGQPIAALLVLCYRDMVEYFTPVIQHDYRDRQPLSFLIFHAMRLAVEEGYRHWNWGGTWRSQQSLHHFKQGWGAVDTPYSYLVSCSAAGLHRLSAESSTVIPAFPWYYVYPHDQLQRVAA